MKLPEILRSIPVVSRDNYALNFHENFSANSIFVCCQSFLLHSEQVTCQQEGNM